ncbi:uncharacterized protein TrAtP1_010160 [Trichoderma atroviride]|uniref:uncharacterized protein n=1 Tax=Hypocrea atroviridis TaxID=63577 RepID=UPI00332DC171|nr:hypothetical protein TrAtP1_010160 [Trichoderma atroviride]
MPPSLTVKGPAERASRFNAALITPRGDIKSVATLDFANCISLNSQQIKEPSGRSFTIACNADRPGGDLATKPLGCSGDCITWCDRTNSCLAAVYHDGQCWLKETLSTASTRTNCQVAVLSSKIPISMSTKKTTSISTQKTTSIATQKTSSVSGVTTSPVSAVTATTSTSTNDSAIINSKVYLIHQSAKEFLLKSERLTKAAFCKAYNLAFI